MKSLYTALGSTSLCFLFMAAPAAGQTFGNSPGDDGPNDRPLVLQPIDDLITKVQDYGINLRGGVDNETAGNTTGGVRKATTNIGQGQIGADLDLQRILGLPGGSIHITEYHDYGTSLSSVGIGDNVKAQEIYKNPNNIFHFGLFSYEQSLLDGRLDVSGGRIAATSYFTHLDYSCQFISGTNCGTPVIANSESGYTLLPSATWGTVAKYNITPNLYAMAGAFEVDSTVQAASGLDWRTNNASGVTVPVELGYKFDGNQSVYPFDIKGGGWYSNGKHADPYSNTNGKSLGLYGGTARNVEDRYGAYVLGEKTVYRVNGSSSHYIALVGGSLQALDPTEIYQNQTFAGLVFNGPFASRTRDSIGFVANYFRISDDEAAFLRDARIRAGGSGLNTQNMFTLELNYSYSLFRGAWLEPDIQYIINPDNSSLPATKNVSQNALVLALKMELVFGDWPSPPPGRPGVGKSFGTSGAGSSDDDDDTGEEIHVSPLTWAGFYAGPDLGYGFGTDRRIGTSTATQAELLSNVSAPKDVVFGGHAGYNFVLPSFAQLGAHGLIGVEGDASGTTGAKTYSLNSTITGSFRETVQGSVRARAGLDFGKTLVYGTGGFAAANLRNNYTSAGGTLVDNGSSNNRLGYTVGAGLEYALNDAWAFKVEYRYTSFGDSNQLLVNTGQRLIDVRHEDDENRVQAGLSYRFGASPLAAPLIARY